MAATPVWTCRTFRFNVGRRPRPGQTGTGAVATSTGRRDPGTQAGGHHGPDHRPHPGLVPADQDILGVAEMGDGPHLAAGGVVDADAGPDVTGRVEGQDLDVAPPGAQVAELVEGQPRLVVVGEDDHIGGHPGHHPAQGVGHGAATVEGALGGRVPQVLALAGHAVEGGLSQATMVSHTW